MKPIKLIMTAFGPYKNEQILDFGELEGNKLFAITGNTGAGKTTIFDAICFALYGEASGEERSEIKGLRSHFADDDTYTSVAFHFEIKGREYKVFRQLPHKKGNNKTETGGKIEIYEIVDEKEVPLVDRFMANDVKDKIYDLIGLTKEQFSQIIMLPQGEFRKLLTSETENKEQILRSVFKTEHYQKIRDVLDQRRKHLGQTVIKKQTERNVHIASLKNMSLQENSPLQLLIEQEHKNSYQVIQLLAEEIGYWNEKVESDKVIITTEETVVKQKEMTFHRVNEINKQIILLSQKQAERQLLTSQEKEITLKEQELALAEKSQALAIYEELAKEARTNVYQKKEHAQRITIQKEELEKQGIAVKGTYEEEKEKDTLRMETQQAYNRLQELKVVIETMDTKEKRVKALQTEVSSLEKQKGLVQEKIDSYKQQRLRYSQEIVALDELVSTIPEKHEQLERMRQEVTVVQSYLKATKSYQESLESLKEYKSTYQSELAEYEQTEKAWIEGQASMLAMHLHDGDSCPVCGSKEHPAKSRPSEETVTKEHLQNAKEKKDSVERMFHGLEALVNQEKQSALEKQKEFEALGYTVEDAKNTWDNLCLQGPILRDEVALLKEKQKEVQQKKKENTEVEQQLETLDKEKVTLDRTYMETTALYIEQKTSYERDKLSLPPTIQTLAQLKVENATMHQQLSTLLHAWKNAQESYESWNQRQIKINENDLHAKKDHEDAVHQQMNHSNRYQEELTKSGFATEEAYIQAKRTPALCQELKKTIESYYKQVTSLESEVNHLMKQVEGHELKDVTALEEEINQYKIELDIKKQLLERSQITISSLNKLQKTLEDIDQEIREEEATYNQLMDLYEVIKGDNSSRISFERYILIEYLDQIVESANMRLKDLSNGQFYLQRSERVEKRNRQSGLGLDVYDAYTGQIRDVKTLSGGEKFNASLCLALGMADVIQAFQGSVSIDTMFIDEGFGSLDEESLSKAVEALIELQQSGRLIGVISHVQELKDAMPAILEVTKTKEGFSQCKFVLK